jgi:hypothetical protein
MRSRRISNRARGRMALRRTPRSRVRPHGEATGGQVFLFDHSEVGQSAALVLAEQGHDETIFRVSGSLEDGTHEFSFPIDSTVESAFISVSLQCLQVVEIATPTGALLRDSDPGWTTTSSRPGASSP